MYAGWVSKGATSEYRKKKKKRIHLPFARLDLDTASESVTEIRFLLTCYSCVRSKVGEAEILYSDTVNMGIKTSFTRHGTWRCEGI